MKTPYLPLAVLFGAMTPIACAFTLDAVGYEGGELSRYPLTVMVPGYGEVMLEADQDLMLVVNPGFQHGIDAGGMPLEFDAADAVKVTLHDRSGELGREVSGDPSEAGPPGRAGSGSGARGWSEIPEPASAGLGLVGLLLLFLARRR
jgi:hypothetical protein